MVAELCYDPEDIELNKSFTEHIFTTTCFSNLNSRCADEDSRRQTFFVSGRLTSAIAHSDPKRTKYAMTNSMEDDYVRSDTADAESFGS